MKREISDETFSGSQTFFFLLATTIAVTAFRFFDNYSSPLPALQRI
jgi:hypothetical protein